MSYYGIVARLRNVKKHPNADRLYTALVAREQIIIGLDNQEGEIGVYFPTDGQLSREMLLANSLYRKHPDTGEPMGGLFDINGRVRAQNIRGAKSFGFWTPLSSLSWAGDISLLKEGDQITTFNDKLICRKYISSGTRRAIHGGNRKGGDLRKLRLKDRFPFFREHFDTDQLVYFVGSIPIGSVLRFSCKAHGTSGRTGHLPSSIPIESKFKNWWNKRIPWRKLQFKNRKGYSYVSGTRRVTLDPDSVVEKGFYSGDSFRNDIHRYLEEHQLPRGVTLFYEIVGYTDSGKRIMPRVSSSKIQDKELRKEIENLYGKEITFSYGCSPNREVAPNWKVLLYRATITNEDGLSFDLPWNEVKELARNLEIETVQEVYRPIVYDGNPEALLDLVEELASGPDPLDSRHLKEGVCVRVEHDDFPGIRVYKYKSFAFKVLEGIIKESNAVDIEEVEDAQAEG